MPRTRISSLLPRRFTNQCYKICDAGGDEVHFLILPLCIVYRDMKHLKRSKSGTQVKSHGCVHDVKIGAIGQFRVPKTLTSKMRLGAQSFL